MVKVLNDIAELGLKKDDVLFSTDNGQSYTFKDETFEDKDGVKVNTSVTKSFSKTILESYKDNLQFDEDSIPEQTKKYVNYYIVHSPIGWPIRPFYRPYMSSTHILDPFWLW